MTTIFDDSALKWFRLLDSRQKKRPHNICDHFLSRHCPWHAFENASTVLPCPLIAIFVRSSIFFLLSLLVLAIIHFFSLVAWRDIFRRKKNSPGPSSSLLLHLQPHLLSSLDERIEDTSSSSRGCGLLMVTKDSSHLCMRKNMRFKLGILALLELSREDLINDQAYHYCVLYFCS